MDAAEITNRGKLFNSIIIGINLVTYITYFIGRFSESGYVYGLQTFVRIAGVVVAIVIIIFTAMLMKENDGKIKGLGLLLAASIVSLVFSALGFMLGIVIWILCGISISQLQKSFNEYSTTQMYSNINQNLQAQNDVYTPQSYGNAYQDPFAGGTQGSYGAQGAYGGSTYGGQDFNQQAEVPEQKYASHAGGFGVQEEPDIDFTNM